MFNKIYVSGSIAYDTIMDFPNEFINYFHPEKLHQINVSFVLKKLEKQLGGTACNIGYNIALNSNLQNNKPEIRILGSVGKDGKDFINFFRNNNVNVDGIHIDKRLYTSAGSVITDTKNNQIWGFYYGAAEKIPQVDFDKIDKDSDFLVISANHKNSFLYFQKQAIKNKIPYFYDPGMTLTWISDDELCKGVLNCRYLIGNDYEIAMITKRINKTINNLTDKGLRIITTLGEKGVRYETRKEKLQVDSYKLKRIIDPTGAGDAWRGGFIASLSQGYEIIDCLRLGNVMASFAIEKYGTVNHHPTIKEIKERLNVLSK